MTVISFWLAVALLVLLAAIVSHGVTHWIVRIVAGVMIACVVVFLYGVSEWMWRVMK